MEGYQGLSVRPANQRQQLSKRSSRSTCTPNAPARWATDVSTLTTASSSEMIAAVSAKSCTPLIGSETAKGSEGPPNCKDIHSTPGAANKGPSAAGSIERRRSTAASRGVFVRAEPAHTRPTRPTPLCRDGKRAAHCAIRPGSDRRYGTLAGIVPNVVPNNSANRMTGQCQSCGGHPSALDTTRRTPRTDPRSRRSGSGTHSNTQAPRSANIGT